MYLLNANVLKRTRRDLGGARSFVHLGLVGGAQVFFKVGPRWLP